MDFNHINYFDAVVLGIMVLSCLFAFFRGLVREILSLAAWIGAGIVTIYYFPAASARLQEHFRNPMLAAGIATVGIYLLALAGFGLINTILVKSIKRGEEAGTLDNLLGLVFGAFRGALIVSFGYFLITVAIPEKEFPDWLSSAKTRPYAAQGAVLLARVAPQYVQEISELQRKATGALENANQPSAGANEAIGGPAQDNGGYNRQVSGQLDRLIDSTNQPPGAGR